MNEVQFCIVLSAALGVWFALPPLGRNLFVVSGIAGAGIRNIATRSVSSVLCMFVVVLPFASLPAILTQHLPEIYK